MAVILLGAALPACTITKVKRGAPLRPSDAAAVSVGQTRAEVLTRLGPPNFITRVQGGTRFHYTYKTDDESAISISLVASSGLSWGKSARHLDRLFISFDHHGRVREIGWPQGFGHDSKHGIIGSPKSALHASTTRQRCRYAGSRCRGSCKRRTGSSPYFVGTLD